MPTKILLLNDVLFNTSLALPEMNSEVQYIFFKSVYQPLRSKTTVMRKTKNQHPEFWGQDIEPGQYNLLKKNITKDVLRIPKNVHQFWISQKQLPSLKKKLSQIARKKYEGYQYRLWTWNDITK